MMRLDGRTAIVLGAGQGIGRLTAHALAQSGATVGCVGRDPERTRAVADEVGGFPLIGDIIKRADMERMFAEAQQLAGAVHHVVDIVGMPRIKPLLDFTDEDWDWQFDIVLRHAFLAVQIGGRAIAAAGGGSIVLVGSTAGISVPANQGPYGAAKAAMQQMAAHAAVELGSSKVRVNVVVPGATRTPRLEAVLKEEQWASVGELSALGTAALPADVAGAILFLTSPLSGHITGQSVVVDGGSTLMPAQLNFALRNERA
jgi:NAD(P)-dependent dehydrogenase (short-subunit alcohol dehydrogenase family)